MEATHTTDASPPTIDHGPDTNNPPDPPGSEPAPAKNSFSRSRRGKVARLPKLLRDRINQMLDDGFSYPRIIRELGNDATGLDTRHLCRWKSGGYQDHLREERLIQQCLARTDRVVDLLGRPGQVTALQATQQVVTAQICQTLAEVGPDILREALAANPLNYFRMLNSFSRLANGALKCERLLDEQALALAAAKPQPADAPKRGLSPETIKEMNDKLRLL